MSEISDLYEKTMRDIVQTKNKFINIVKTINEDEILRKLFTPTQKNHLQALIKLWRNNKYADAEYYFTFKDHHARITGSIAHDKFKEMWNDYISSCLEFRCNLLKLSHLSDLHKQVPAQTSAQKTHRIAIEKQFSSIKSTHCKICGDIKNIMNVKTYDGIINICEECYDIQINM